MATSFTIHDSFSVDAETWWEKVFFSAEYNRALYFDGLRFKGYDILTLEKDAAGIWTRRVRTEPAVDAPAAVRKIVGDSISYEETGRMDPTTTRLRFTVVPSKLADKFESKGEVWVEPRGDQRIDRYVTTELNVKVFGVGKMIESFIEKTTRDNYQKAAVFTTRWIAENLGTRTAP
jgi:hypothetical protein